MCQDLALDGVPDIWFLVTFGHAPGGPGTMSEHAGQGELLALESQSLSQEKTKTQFRVPTGNSLKTQHLTAQRKKRWLRVLCVFRKFPGNPLSLTLQTPLSRTFTRLKVGFLVKSGIVGSQRHGWPTGRIFS